MLLTALFAHPANAQSDGSLAPEAQQIFDMVNQARREHGLPPLALNAQLTLAAQNHVDDVIANGNWGHYGSDGSTVVMRTARAGYGSSWVSENWVAASTPEQAMNWWMNDWIHRVNILTPRWDDIGIGVAPAEGGFWIFVTDFGNIDGSAAPVAVAPLQDGTAVDTGVAAAPESLPAGGMDYAIQPGDTLLGIGLRYGIEWQDIALANNMAESDILSVGQVIHLPGRGGNADDAAPAANLRVSDQTHTVRPGETLSIIAARYGVAWQDVAAVNALGEYSLLQIGQELKLPATDDEAESSPAPEAEVTGTAASALAAKAAATAEDAGAASSAPESGGVAEPDADPDAAAADTSTLVLTVQAATAVYTVRAGDTLSGIAGHHNVTWQALATANGLSEHSYLQIGQALTIPGGTVEPLRLRQITGETDGTGGAALAATVTRSYTVSRGDTIFAIAIRHGVDWQELLRINGLNEESILQPGQTLQLP